MVMHTYAQLDSQAAYRLVNSKFPPESLFDDVADADEFEAIYAIQAMTNPRIQDEIGNLNLIPKSEIPFGIDGVNYVTAPFTHTNQEGSRFSDGAFGMLYIADKLETAIAETRHHQEKTFNNIEGLHFDSITMRGIVVVLSGNVVDCTANEEIHHPEDYSHSRALGHQLRKEGELGIKYNSVRLPDSTCWGLFSPKTVQSAIQSKHYEFIYDGTAITHVREVTLSN